MIRYKHNCRDCGLPIPESEGAGVFTICTRCFRGIYAPVIKRRDGFDSSKPMDKNIQILRKSGLSLRAIGRVVELDHTTVRTHLKKIKV